MSVPPAQLPEFPASLQWLDRPALHVTTGLRAHVTAVLFWRLGCVHCRHALAEFASLQAEFAGRPFAVVAVHVPSCAAERDEPRLQRTLAQLADAVTVAVDAERACARSFAITALPYVVLADVDGSIRFHGRGEPNRLRVAEAIETLLQTAARNGTAAAVPFAPCRRTATARVVPTGIALDGEKVWCSAAGHRRVYELSRTGEVRQAIGEGRPGGFDGSAAAARFHTPGAVLLHRDHLLVADAGTHTLRAIDRGSGAVTTWCGTGKRATDRLGGGFGTHQGLCSPNGLLAHDGGIYIAQQGAHQFWQFDPETQSASAWLGTGTRSLRDGGEEATFTEPSGMAVVEQTMFVADAGNGALRSIDLAHNFVRTVAQGLLRPSAIAGHGEHVLVAASWQPAVMRVPVAGGEPAVLFDASMGLVEPCALAVRGDELWIADAGADCLFHADLVANEPRLVRVDLRGTPPVPEPASTHAAMLGAALVVREFSDVTLRIALPTEPTAELDSGAPWEVDLVDEAQPVLACDRHATVTLENGCAVVLAPIAACGDGTLRIAVRGQVRSGPEARPAARTWRYVVRVAVSADGALDGEVVPVIHVARG